ncbi:unnamed protein product [Gemmata massiliana]|uniref:Uncharacterized protein n=1 Tax=Gemmata massiliana TaxID=1210884 RepID=A0A6P2DL84_9BACT|nr:hypothetical protein [Gemmata massiliana]VTS03554.1 unnamed protein product [Gemmata massiliana]
MQVRLRQPHRGMPPGAVWVPPWEHLALELIAKGIAEPLDAAPAVIRETVANVAPPAPQPTAAKPAKPKPAKAPKPAKQ